MWDGRHHWYNIDTKVSVWNKPQDVSRAEALADGEELPPVGHQGPKPFMMRRAEYAAKLQPVLEEDDSLHFDDADRKALEGTTAGELVLDRETRRQVYVELLSQKRKKICTVLDECESHTLSRVSAKGHPLSDKSEKARGLAGKIPIQSYDKYKKSQ